MSTYQQNPRKSLAHLETVYRVLWSSSCTIRRLFVPSRLLHSRRREYSPRLHGRRAPDVREAKEDREHGPHPHIAEYLQVETQASVGGTHADANNTAPGMATATAALGALCGQRGAAGLAGSLAIRSSSSSASASTPGCSRIKRTRRECYSASRLLRLTE